MSRPIAAAPGGRASPDYAFYMAFNFFRLAAIFHGIKGRVIRGTAASAQARERVAVLPELMALARAQAHSRPWRGTADRLHRRRASIRSIATTSATPAG